MRNVITACGALALCLVTAGSVRGAVDPGAAARKKQAKQHFDKGHKLQDLLRFDDAIREYEAAYELVPLPQLLFNLGQAHRLKGDHRKALESYEKFLAADPKGAGSDEARRHIKLVKLKIEMEDKEAAARRAQEEADAARRKAEQEALVARQRAEEADAARRKAEQEALVARQKSEAEVRRRAEEAARVRRIAEEDAARRRRAQAEADRLRRIEEARASGGGLRGGGTALIAIGVAGGAVGGLAYLQYESQTNKVDDLRNTPTTKPEDLKEAVRQRDLAQNIMKGMFIAGGAAFVGGIVLHQIGAYVRDSAVEEASKPVSVTLSTTLAPDFWMVGLDGTF